MGWWSAYFFAKLLLYAGGYINFSVWWNFGFAVFTALPVRNDRQALTKNLLGSVVAVVLLYHDSWLPPLGRVLSQSQNLAQFSLPYLMELLGRFISLKVVLQLIILLAVYVLLKRKLRMSTFVFIGIGGVIFAPMLAGKWSLGSAGATAAVPANPAVPSLDIRSLSVTALNQKVAEFYAQEAKRQVRFAMAPAGDSDYDIVILHICSLSWDDLQQVGRTDNALFARFDLTFTQFNSAASYSGPAAIRLLRGNCGQTTHQQLYDSAASGCLLIDGLQNLGFKPYWAMNHDGHFGNFFGDVTERGGMPASLQNASGLPVAQRAFDDTPIYDDHAVLMRWWQQRQRDAVPRAVLYYNTISLHDGNRLEDKGMEGQSLEDKRGSADYAARFDRLVQDVNRFVSELTQANRPVLLLVVPEHGAALRGDKRQIAGLREIPTPGITHVPVGMLLINGQTARPAPVSVAAPVSYLGLTQVLSNMIAHNPFGISNLDLADYTRDIPATESFAENEGTLMWQHGDQAMLRTPDGDWQRW